MDVTHEHIDALKRIARRSRMLSHPQLHSELKLSAHDCQAAIDELITMGVLRQATSDKGTTFYWLAKDAVPESRD